VHQAMQNRELLRRANNLEFYSEVLTNSAENFIITADSSWLKIYNESYQNYTELYTNIDRFMPTSELQRIFSTNDSLMVIIHQTEQSAIEQMLKGEREKALQTFKSTQFWQAKSIFQNRIKALKSYYITGEKNSDEHIKEVFKTIEGLNLLFLISFIVVISLLFILARYVARVFWQLNVANKKNEVFSKKIGRIQKELEERISQCHRLQTELKAQHNHINSKPEKPDHD